MHWLRRARRAVADFIRRDRFDRAMHEELETFLDLDAEARVRQDARPSRARRAARADFGGIEVCKERLRDERTGALIDSVVQDVRLSLRLLFRQPTFAAAAILTIALGTFPLAATTGLANWLFFAPAPGVTGAHRLVRVEFLARDATGDIDPASLSYLNRTDVMRGLRSLTGLAGRASGSAAIAVPGLDALLVDVDYVTHDYFDVLGMRLAVGRTFLPEDDREPGGRAVVVLGHGLAAKLFGTPDAAVGREVLANGLDFIVVGVAPPEFRGLKNDHFTQMWIPGATWDYAGHSPRERWRLGRGVGLFDEFVGRLAEGVDVELARAELTTAVRAVGAAYPAENAHLQTVEVVIEHQRGMSFSSRNTRGEVAVMISMFTAAGSLILLLAGANVGNLLLFRGSRRRPEIAMRAALGASPGRLLRAHVVDVVLLSLAGGALGLGITFAVARVFAGVIVPEAGFLTLPIDWRVGGLVVTGVVVVGLVFGGAPAFAATSRSGLAPTMRQTGARGGRRLRSALTVVQLALSLSLLVGAALLLVTVRNLAKVDIGFDPAPVASGHLFPQTNGYDDVRSLAFYRDLLVRTSATPGVAAASVSGQAPGTGSNFINQVHLPGQDRERAVTVFTNNVSADYFAVLGLPLRHGRTFAEDEVFARPDGTCGPVIISESLAIRLFGTSDAVGRIVILRMRPPMDCQVVGVSADVRNRPDDGWESTLYRPLGRSRLFRTVVLARAVGPLEPAFAALREAVASIDPAVPLHLPRSLAEEVGFHLAGRRLVSSVLSALALLGLLMAAVGLYGLVSETVVDRTREFAVRIAIGASPPRILAAVLRRSILLAAVGTAVGMALAVALSGAISSQLFRVTALDPWVYVGASGLLAAIVVVASLAPAIRATRVNPVDVLRGE